MRWIVLAISRFAVSSCWYSLLLSPGLPQGQVGDRSGRGGRFMPGTGWCRALDHVSHGGPAIKLMTCRLR
eukprot:9913622-Prorocentrum_lima.AAC.1